MQNCTCICCYGCETLSLLLRDVLRLRVGGGSWYKLQGPGGQEGDLGARQCYKCCLSRHDNYLLIVQINSFRRCPRHSAPDRQFFFRWSLKIFSRVTVAWGPKNLSPVLEPSLGGPWRRTLRKISVRKRDNVAGEWRKLYNEELHDLYYYPPNIVRVIK